MKDRKIASLKTIFGRGMLIVFSVGIAGFFIYVVLDYITRMWKPVFKPFVVHDPLVTIIGVCMILFVIAATGYLFSPAKLSGRWGRFWGSVPVINWFLGERRVPTSVRDMPGALIRFSEGSYYIAALLGEQKFKNKNGEIELMYKLYCPSAPMPWSGLPLIFARADCVTLLKLSFAEIYGITTSFGKTTPKLLEELDINKTEEPESAYFVLLDEAVNEVSSQEIESPSEDLEITQG